MTRDALREKIAGKLAEAFRHSGGVFNPFMLTDAILALIEPVVGEREAVAKVLEGFAVGVFVRSTVGDHESGWALKLVPYVTALAKLQASMEERP